MKKIRIPESLTTLAYKTIRNHILDGRLSEKSRLNENSLAQRLGISKSPVREALTKLESEGLIRIEPRRGACLRKFSISDIHDLCDLREALEAHAVSTAEMNAETLGALRSSLVRMRSSRDAGDKTGYIEADMHFHNLLAGAAGNERLRELLDTIQKQVWLFQRKKYDLSRSCAMPEHKAIVDALARRDRRKAELLMREHISNVRQRLLTRVSEEPKQRSRAAGGSV